MNSPIPFKDVPEGSMFWHSSNGNYGQYLKLAQADTDVKRSGRNAVIVVRNPSPGHCGNGWLTVFREETKVFLEKPEEEEFVRMMWEDVPAGALCKLAGNGNMFMKASDDVRAWSHTGTALNAMLVEGRATGWFQNISNASVFVLKDTLSDAISGESE